MPTMADVPEKCAERHEDLCPPSSAPWLRHNECTERWSGGMRVREAIEG
jgi:hypothetical protein